MSEEQKPKSEIREWLRAFASKPYGVILSLAACQQMKPGMETAQLIAMELGRYSRAEVGEILDSGLSHIISVNDGPPFVATEEGARQAVAAGTSGGEGRVTTVDLRPLVQAIDAEIETMMAEAKRIAESN